MFVIAEYDNKYEVIYFPLDESAPEVMVFDTFYDAMECKKAWMEFLKDE